ncbi:MAG TPA: hypothetical protein VF655_12055 [Allosphingosinicella sp.]
MRTFPILLAALAAAGCSQAEPPKAPPGAMESFAVRQNDQDAADETARIDAARARETQRAADARQTKNADDDIARFAAAEKAMESNAEPAAAK